MARRKKARTDGGASCHSVRPLMAFYHGGGAPSRFGYARFYWQPGEGQRESVEARVTRKRRPAGLEASFDTAAKVEVLLPTDAPQDYADPDFVVRHYEASLPTQETVAFVQVTLRFPDASNLHAPYEVARRWGREFFVDAFGTPVMIILHAPHLANSDAEPHVHLLVFPRKVGLLGWMGVVNNLGSDRLALKARLSWSEFRGATAKT